MEYQPKVILITGGAGFIASHVVIHFVNEYPQCTIINVDKLDYCSSLKNLEEIQDAPNYKFYIADITDHHTMQKIFEMEHVDTVLHFAAQTHVDNSFGNSFQFTHNNIYGTHVLLEIAKANHIKRFIHVSTDEVYGQVIGNAATENSLLNPTNPYSATKAGAEFIARAFYQSFGLPLIITRGNNVFGPHQFPEKLIPKFITLLDRGKNCPLHGCGEEKRSFIYVQDVVNAFDVVLRKGIVGQIYNIGTTREISNNEVAHALLDIFQVPKEEQDSRIYHVKNRCFNDQRYSLDVSKLEKLGWRATTSFEEGLKKTVEWYLEHRNNWERTDEALVPHPRFGQKEM
ncbi:dtdp-d-glucose 4 6-dehydratase putative [Entamoeba histolytica]|uniref:dTDP-D-glucose 4,6-dehydratase, putative n=4 Tax=Entamoeba histolytica TaxID=5759 RepID=C4LVV7_ENTH1|nr:dTDP-D-glucose 4,6-dehydratase, putative [Entamoeba histolytica HM-1:IMSS]EAL51122.1 dTDP-D-glucose 4,6-dehydratase, putative [Entamoeba histolytica HM-1:IMSS]EMD45188.1 dTDPD-glucose 4,6-dehydratase, putative [Entamoeba histolytica KU27]GAT92814.1 dtdp-d-glucose 4 6-dehydratase putative [Entamoeba histolytica]|eukprot:XP_656509.1 dTDP-D-glucose 4,6-dehydratase, putative [Entamoeba histolytica HM-1:IMSS]